jgi:hypothetical protein
MNNGEKLRQGLTTLARESHEMAREKGGRHESSD